MVDFLNSLFPPLPRWHLVLLVYTFVMVAAECLILTTGLG